MKPLHVVLLILLLGPASGAAQELEFHPPAAATDAAVPAVMRDLAERILPVYQESDPDRYLRNLSALQMVSGNYPAAFATREQLRDRHRNADARRPINRAVLYDIYARARNLEAQSRTPFPKAFATSYRDVVSKLDDQDAYALTGWLEAPPATFRDTLQRAFDQWRPKGSIPQPDALELIWTYLTFDAYRSFHPFVAALNAEDDSRRYVIDQDVLIDSPQGESISAVVVRPKDDSKPLPTLLEFTIHVDAQNSAKECAAHGYVGVVAFSRGERRSPGKITPYLHDGDDAREVIGWIAKQPWSDGRVGMYGAGFSAFTQWAVAKRLPAALKAIATWGATAPGVDFPMAGNIFRNSAYRWSACVTNTTGLDEKACNDDAYWRSLDEAWYTSGKPYRDLDSVFGQHNAIFRSWLNHPNYDRFWQRMIPDGQQLARINIPVLAMTGYYAGGEIGTLYYFEQHHRHDPHANHTLLIGPYDDSAMQRGATSNLAGYQVDQAAVVDLRELRYQWFDHVLRGGAKPALLKDRVNYQVMGANEWHHVPTLEAMGKATMRFYLDDTLAADSHLLSQRKPAEGAFLKQTVNLADRSDAGWAPPPNLIFRGLQSHHGVTFASEPLKREVEFSGLFCGRLDFNVNKVDMDLSLALYELLPDGQYLLLFDPAYEFRASDARDRSSRHLLKAGQRQQLTFTSERLMSRKLQAGSRLVIVLSVIKRPDRQINYGTGRDVAGESIADGKIPLKIRWYGDSYVDIPVSR
jgi:putative CocE/NonD family hydrolase